MRLIMHNSAVPYYLRPIRDASSIEEAMLNNAIRQRDSDATILIFFTLFPGVLWGNLHDKLNPADKQFLDELIAAKSRELEMETDRDF